MSDEFPAVNQCLTSALTQTCVGCGDEIAPCVQFVRDHRRDSDGEPWHPRCHAIAGKWLADALAEAAQLEAELATERAKVEAMRPIVEAARALAVEIQRTTWIPHSDSQFGAAMSTLLRACEATP